MSVIAPRKAAGPLRIVLPSLHPGQKVIDNNQSRFKCVVCGRRFGKTTYGVRQCVRGALEDPGVYWWVGPNYPSISASAAWPMLKRLIAPISGVTIREADRYITFANGAEIWIKSADNPDTLRGPKLKGVVFDEFAQIKPETWTEVIRPALSDLKGWALFIGTPKGKNWAYRLFEQAKARKDWAAFCMPTTTNPYIDPAEIEAAREDMSEESFKQEYEADFGASQYLVYPEIIPEIHRWKGPVPEFISYHGGCDFGGDSIGAHSSVTAIAGRTQNDDVIIFDCFKQAGPNVAERQYDWMVETEQKITVLRKSQGRYSGIGPKYMADRSQMVGIQFMRRMGLNVFKTKGGPDSVQEGIEAVHRRLKIRRDPVTGRDRPKLFWTPNCPWVEDDMMAYRNSEPETDKELRKNPLKINDDVPDAVRYLIEGIDRNPVGNPMEIYGRMVPSVV